MMVVTSVSREMEKTKAQRWIDAISECSLPGLGITRPSYSAEETAAMRVVELWARGHGLVTDWDFAGNLHVTLRGHRQGPTIAMGSHVDSVPSGGRYDGVAGVVAAMLVFERVLGSHDEKKPTDPALRLIVYRGEESAWFGKCYIGSLALFGKLPKGALLLRRRDTAEPLCSAMGNVPGGQDDRVMAGESIIGPGEISRFYEVHIEQGPALVDLGFPIGIVTAIRGNLRYLKAVAKGKADHSGTTPTHLRHDAVLGFANFLHELSLRHHARERAGEDLVMTCGIAGTVAGKHAVSIIADEFRFALEFRSTSPVVLAEFAQDVAGLAALFDVELGPGLLTEPVMLDTQIATKLMVLAAGVPFLPSGAGHDAAVFQQNGIPTGMIFIRNQHGSHNPKEAMDLEDFMVAVDVLHGAVTRGV